MDTALVKRRRRQLTYRSLIAEQRRTIRVLQETIQPTQGSADIAGLHVAVRCTSAERDLQIGGDWYLAMPVPGGDVILAVGDATGHGLVAAAGMLRLKFAMAALAAEDAAPARVLGRLNALACRSGSIAAASAVVARYRSATAELTWARAGHPPLVLTGSCGAVVLADFGGPLLGVTGGAAYAEVTRRLNRREQVLFHTDGLYRRGQTTDEWVEALGDRLPVVGGDHRALLDSFEYRAAGDDACVLVARRIS